MSTKTRDEAACRVTVVVLTHNRADELARTLVRLRELPEQPPIVVVDNASSDGSTQLVHVICPHALVVRSETNLGAAGRNLGVAQARTPYVAFCDDDTWWAPGALALAARRLDSHPRLGALAARVIVEPAGVTDETCLRMAASPLRHGEVPGPALMGFMAGAVAMRRDVFIAAGGYEPRFFLGAEEALLAIDIAARGWAIVYDEKVIVHHYPSARRDNAARRILRSRNEVWIAWMRLPPAMAWRRSVDVLGSLDGLSAARCAGAVLFKGGWTLRRRRVIPAALSSAWARVFLEHRLPKPRHEATSQPTPRAQHSAWKGQAGEPGTRPADPGRRHPGSG